MDDPVPKLNSVGARFLEVQNTIMADPEGSSSSEDGSEPMEVNIPPEIARELGQGPIESTTTPEGERVVDKPEQMEGEEELVEGELGPEEDTLDLKKIATDYAQYLAVNSRQDVSILSHLFTAICKIIGFNLF